jgi:isoleucyl-tRNA synthetase
MFATLGGSLALLLGLVVLLVPLLTPELSRARDAVWGAVLLLLGLVLVTSSDRLGGSPMVAVLCGSLLIGRLGSEVGQQRWRALTPEEQQRLGSGAHWRTALGQVLASLGALQGMASESLSGLRTRLPQAPASVPTAFKGKGKGKAGGTTKRWVRPEADAGDHANAEVVHPATSASGVQGNPETSVPASAEGALEPAPELEETPPAPQQEPAQSPSETPPAAPAAASPEPPQPPVIEVGSFTEIEALVDAAWGEAPEPAQAPAEPADQAVMEPTQPEDASLASAVNPSSPIAPQAPAEEPAEEPTGEPAEAGATAPRNDAG